MIYRIVNSFFMGFAFVSLLDFLYFIGLKLHYFDFYHISEYFNVIFIDNQNFYLLLPSFFIVGYLMLYSTLAKVFIRIYILCILISISALYQPIGNYLAKSAFMKENQTFQVGSRTFNGDFLYKGRRNTYIYRKDLSKTIKLLNTDVKAINDL
jgi:hypothetical protein